MFIIKIECYLSLNFKLQRYGFCATYTILKNNEIFGLMLTGWICCRFGQGIHIQMVSVMKIKKEKLMRKCEEDCDIPINEEKREWLI